MDDWSDLSSDVKKLLEDSVKDIAYKAGDEMMQSLTTVARSQTPKSGTPVDTGNLMANTVVSVNRVDATENSDVDPTGKKTYAKGMAKIKMASAWDRIYIQNNTDYNKEAEFEGWAITPAYRYFRTAIENVETYIERIK